MVNTILAAMLSFIILSLEDQKLQLSTHLKDLLKLSGIGQNHIVDHGQQELLSHFLHPYRL